MANDFCVISLGDWLAKVKQTNLKAIPAQLIGELDIDDVFGWQDGDDSPAIDRLEAAAVEAVRLHREMGFPIVLRWDYCAGEAVKMAMDRAPDTLPGAAVEFTLDDMRLCNILEDARYGYDQTTVKLWKRPLVTPVYWETHPVEFRVFVAAGKVLGVSNYYPQRDLPESYRDWAQRAAMWAEHLLRKRWCPKDFSLDLMLMPASTDPAWTIVHPINLCDYSTRFDEPTLVFLEAGPPHLPMAGAHPCCFKVGEIDGIALSDRNSHE